MSSQTARVALEAALTHHVRKVIDEVAMIGNVDDIPQHVHSSNIWSYPTWGVIDPDGLVGCIVLGDSELRVLEDYFAIMHTGHGNCYLDASPLEDEVRNRLPGDIFKSYDLVLRIARAKMRRGVTYRFLILTPKV